MKLWYFSRQMWMNVFCFLRVNMGAPAWTSMEDIPVCVKTAGRALTVKWVRFPQVLMSLCLPWVYVFILFHSEGYKQVSSHPNIEFIYRCIVIIVLIKNFNQIFWLQKNLNWLKLTFNYTDLGSSIFAVMDESIFFSFRYWWVSKEPLLQQRKLYKFLWLVLLPLP